GATPALPGRGRDALAPVAGPPRAPLAVRRPRARADLPGGAGRPGPPPRPAPRRRRARLPRGPGMAAAPRVALVAPAALGAAGVDRDRRRRAQAAPRRGARRRGAVPGCRTDRGAARRAGAGRACGTSFASRAYGHVTSLETSETRHVAGDL